MGADERFPEVPSTLASRLPGLSQGTALPGADGGGTAAGGLRYRSEGVIGRGGTGEVHRVVDADLGRALAMKVLLVPEEAGAAPDPGMLARFLEEAQVTGQLDHPGIVPLHELGVDARGRIYFTMRLVRGQHLGEVFEKARAGEDGWSLPAAVEALVKVADALAFAHAKGVVHRDVKPQNVMAGRFGEVYVMDWGLAKVAGRPEREERPGATESLARVSLGREPDAAQATRRGQVCGTPAYMAPEQALGDVERVDARSDVYAFGSMLYELLAGHSPYLWKGAELDAVRVVLAVRAGPPPPIQSAAPGAPAELAAICRKAMARDPGARYADMRDVARDLRAWLAGRPVSALPLTPLRRGLRWCRRYPWAAAALLAVTLGSGFGLWQLSTVTRDLQRDLAREAAKQEALTLEEATAFYNEAVVRAVVAANGERPILVKDGWTPADMAPAAGAPTAAGDPPPPHVIPLPATFLTTLADRLSLSLRAHGQPLAQVRHYSPWPWRDQPPLDAFAERAVRELGVCPSGAAPARPGAPGEACAAAARTEAGHEPSVEAEEGPADQRVLRYATPRRMASSCLACHNAASLAGGAGAPGGAGAQGWRQGAIASPKTGWRAGDVRGVLEIVEPLDRTGVSVAGTLTRVGVLMLGLTLLAALTLLRSVRRERRRSP